MKFSKKFMIIFIFLYSYLPLVNSGLPIASIIKKINVLPKNCNIITLNKDACSNKIYKINKLLKSTYGVNYLYKRSSIYNLIFFIDVIFKISFL